MNVVLWIVQVILAVVYAVAGIMKVAVTDSELDWSLARIISRADIAAFWE